jgi:hypothetical protein
MVGIFYPSTLANRLPELDAYRFSPFFIQFPTVIRPLFNRLCPFFTVFTVLKSLREKYIFLAENAEKNNDFVRRAENRLGNIAREFMCDFRPQSLKASHASQVR